MHDNQDSNKLKKILSALFYAGASLLLTTVNKVVLTSYGFPSFEFLGLGQLVAAVIIVGFAKWSGLIKFPNLNRNLAKKILPLSTIFLGNMFFGLGGTQKVSLPMFTVLRRFSILFTMIAEYLMFRTKASLPVQLSVYGMILGSIVAASADLAFDVTGYFFILLNDVFTAANGVYTKKALNAKELDEYALLFFNSAFLLLPMTLYVSFSGELETVSRFTKWNDPTFAFFFVLSCVMGLVNNYSILLCTAFNSALTTTVIGALKNILTVYIGMFVGGDYVFSWTNFIGLNLSVVASLVYSYAVFSEKEGKRPRPAVTVA